MKVTVIGTGYVGLVAGACLAETGNDIICADIDEGKIARLNAGEIPIYEPGLEPLVERNLREKRLRFTTDVAGAVRASDVIFIAVGTPPDENGSADLQHVLAVARAIGQAMNGEKVVITKSTVPVGTAARVKAAIQAETTHPVHVCSNPEFLKEGAAVEDFMKPDRVVLGVDSEHAGKVLAELYAPFVRSGKAILLMDIAAAEITKYAANAMLATRISFMNAIAQLCEAAGADVDRVRRGIGTDERIGAAFLYAGVGYGGSCLVGRETALVRREGRASLVSLEALFQDCAMVPSSVPGDPAPEAVWADDLHVLSWSPQRGPEWRPARFVTRRWYEGEILGVRTKLGRRVRCTPDHPFVVSDKAGGSVGVKLAAGLTTGDWVPVALGHPAPASRETAALAGAGAAPAHAGRSEQDPPAALATPRVRGRLTEYRPGLGTAWTQITRTSSLPFQGWVYSLEVPGTETFVTTAGLVVHNCFPKDVKALIRTMDQVGADASILKAVEAVNEGQKQLLVRRVAERFGKDLSGRTFAVWGLAFKPNTDDMREAPSLVTIPALLERGARVVAHDPVAMEEARRHFGDSIRYAGSNYEALEGADALLIHTEWLPYRRPDFQRMKALLKTPVIFDGRNLYRPEAMEREGFEHYSVGRRAVGRG